MITERDKKFYGVYAKVQHGLVVVRYSVRDPWGNRGWPPSLAREFGQYVIELADEAERDSRRYRELLALLEDGPDDETLDDLALRLIRGGYRKKS